MKKAVLSLLCLIFLYGSCIALAENDIDNEIIVNYDKHNTKGMDKNITTFDNVVESETGNVDNTANDNIIVDNNDINTVVSVANDATANKTDGDVNINGDAILTETISVKNEAVESIINDDEKQNQYKDKGIITNISADDIKTDEGRLFVSKFNFGSDFYFAFGGNMFTTITGVESYKKNNRLYSIGWDISLSWHVGGGVHIFTAFGWQIDMFDKITAGVARNKISPDINFYGRFGIKYIISKFFSIEPYINFGAILLRNGRMYNYYDTYGRVHSGYDMNEVGMMTALGVDFVLFRFLIVGAQLQYNLFSSGPFNDALIGLGHEARLLNQQRWQHHIAIAGKIGLKFDSLYLSS